MKSAITAAPNTSANSGSSSATSASCTASPGCRRSKLPRAAAPFDAWPAGRPHRARTWCSRSTSSCNSWWKTSTALAVAHWWRWTRATAKCWPSSASPPSTPTCLSTASMSRTGRCSTSPSTSRCSTGPCAAPIRQVRPTSPSWPWPPCRPASAVPAPWCRTTAPGPMADTPSAAMATPDWDRWTWCARSCCRATSITTRWPTRWGWT